MKQLWIPVTEGAHRVTAAGRNSCWADSHLEAEYFLDEQNDEGNSTQLAQCDEDPG